MEQKPYHHGNLKNELIEKGLELIDRNGVENLSMRELAKSIGVSNAAPYSHFKNKEAFLDAIQDYITEKLMNSLTDVCNNCSDKSKILLELGKRYIIFFYNNPLYYQFLFLRRSIDINEYGPFLLFKDMVFKTLNGKDINDLNNKTIAMWAMVHGLSQIHNIKSVVDSCELERSIEDILSSINI